MSTSPNNDPDTQQLPPAGLEQDESKAANSSPKSSSEEEVETFHPEPHALLHLIQCPRCSQPLRAPLHLPCGYTICRSCLPPLKRRADVSYPQGEGREEGFTCFLKGRGCGDGLSSEHALADCGADVVLSKIVDVFEKVLHDNENDTNQRTAADIQIQWKTPSPTADGDEADDDAVATSLEVSKASINFGRYLGTYKLMREGGLPYDAKDVVYEDTMITGEGPPDDLNDSIAKLDDLVLKQLRHGIRYELDCQVCYSLIFKPWISLCGHTFCGECSNRVLDHSDICPLCRRKMYIPLTAGARSTHMILDSILKSLFPEETKAREAAIQADYGPRSDQDDGLQLPLFACALVFPSTSIHLHIFEPRYRLMIRRALESGRRRFGMVVDNFNGDHPGVDHNNSERSPLMPYGTLVSIDSWEFLPDGRIMLTVIGTSKFKVLRTGLLDGYYIASTERVDDISLAEEEHIEAREVAAAAGTTGENHTTSQTEGENEPSSSSSREPSLDSLSTQQLMQTCMDFIEKRRREATPALYRRAIGMFGQPPTDPANFPYWFASVLPIADEEAYMLLPLTSVRERLKLAATWARMLDDRGWSVSSSSTCVIL